jgi:lipid-A-disaccharide synthase
VRQPGEQRHRAGAAATDGGAECQGKQTLILKGEKEISVSAGICPEGFRATERRPWPQEQEVVPAWRTKLGDDGNQMMADGNAFPGFIWGRPFVNSSRPRLAKIFSASLRLCVKIRPLKPKTFMLIAGEASGDLLAAELVSALRGQLPDAKFFGAGGTRMAAAGVESAFDLTQHSVIGITEVLKKYFEFRRLFNQLLALAIARQPDVVIGIDFGGFNLRFGQAVKQYVRENPFSKWNPKIVQFVSPQVWASRPGRADKLARDYDLLLSIFPFEKDWYAQRVPPLRVEFVGHPMIGRFTIEDLRLTRGSTDAGSGRNDEAQKKSENRNAESGNKSESPHVGCYHVLLLPGSRKSELQRHLPVMLGALKLIQEKLPAARAKMVLPNPALVQLAKTLGAELEIQIGELPRALATADVALASTGTVTMECACFGVPTVTLYKTSWLTYEIGKRIVTVKSLTMPNLLAGEMVFPEFVQHDATPENLSRAALELVQDPIRREIIRVQLAKIILSLGEPGAARRAADAILTLLP